MGRGAPRSFRASPRSPAPSHTVDLFGVFWWVLSGLLGRVGQWVCRGCRCGCVCLCRNSFSFNEASVVRHAVKAAAAGGRQKKREPSATIGRPHLLRRLRRWSRGGGRASIAPRQSPSQKSLTATVALQTPALVGPQKNTECETEKCWRRVCSCCR